MVAKGQALANGGLGVSGIPVTFVFLNWATGSQKPKEILEFANEPDTTAGEAVQFWRYYNQPEKPLEQLICELPV
jgi:hypothetical protein